MTEGMPAAGEWQTGPAPKDGSYILFLNCNYPFVARWTTTGKPTKSWRSKAGWVVDNQFDCLFYGEPEYWTRILHPEGVSPAPWDKGPEDDEQ